MMEEQMFDLKRGGMICKAAGAAQLRKYGQYFEYLENTCWQVSPALEYIAEGPVRLTYKINEDINVSSLAETGNTFFSKILTTVCGTCREIRLLKAEAKKFYNKLIIHGEQCTDYTVYKIGSLFLDLQDLSIYVNRISTVIYLIIQQLSYLAHSTHREIYLPLLIEHLIDLFVILVTFDEVISGQPAIIEQWKIYQVKVRSVIHNSLHSNTPHKEILSYEKLLKNLHSQLLSKTLFLKSIEHVMDINKSAVMGNHVICFLKNIMLHIEDKGSNNVVVHRNWIRANVGVVVLFKLFGVCDKKLLKRVVDVNKKLYVVSLFGNVVWLPQDFLVNRLPREGLSSISTQAGEKFLAARMQKFPVIVNNLVQRAMLWCIEMKVLLIKTGFQIFSEIERKRNLLLDILALVCQMREDVLVVTNLHGFLMKPMSRSTVQLVCRLVEAQKALEISFYTFAPRIVLAQSQVLQQLTYQILAILELVRKALGQTGTGSGGVSANSASISSSSNSSSHRSKAVSYISERLDALSLIYSSARLLNGPASPERRLVLRCALACASQLTENFREDEVIRLRFFLDTYDAIIDLFEQLAFNCDYLVLLQQQAMLPAYLTLAAETGVGPLGHLSRILQAVNSAALQQKSAVMPIFRLAEKRSTLSCCLLEPTCRDIETELRLHVYSHLRTSMDGVSGSSSWMTVTTTSSLLSPLPLESVSAAVVTTASTIDTITRLRDGTRLVRAEPLILIGGLLLSGQRYVEHYLDVTFYNLTSVALHDWRAYDSMHALAKHKFRIENVSEQLPTQTLEQGLDALEIMRNIHVFVSCYFYNLHMQTFIEQMSTGRHLNTIGIRHVANSIRTHGIGIISTSVNFVYQFLCVKLHTLSQFLFDEHIKSRLSRDIHYVRLQKERVAPAYGYERAEKFQRAIRKLGMTSEGLSYLDQFRQLITQIGNALGYVRLIRSAGLHASAKTVAFLPPKVCHVSPSAEDYGDSNNDNNSNNKNNEDTITARKVSMRFSLKSVQAAANRFDADLANLGRNFTEGTHYFQLLVDVFAVAFRDPGKYQHLQQFYAIIPPLTLSFIDCTLDSKEKLFKKKNSGAAFTDDGFAIGLAYINALLGQSSVFDSLQWFKTVQKHLIIQKDAVKSQAEHEDEKLRQTRALTLKRLEERSAEFQLLYYTLSGARVLFK